MRWPRTCQTLLGGALLVMTLSALVGCGLTGSAPTVTPSASSQEGVLRVRIEESIIPGVPVPTSSTTPTPHPFIEGPVRVIVTPPGAPKQVVADQMTPNGVAEFRLSAGRYWVILPTEDQPYIGHRGISTQFLPDRSEVDAWSEVNVPRGGQMETTLTFKTIWP